MDQKINKEIAKKLMEIKGEARGVILKTDGEFLLKEKGKESIKKAEEEFKNLGYPLKYDEINSMGFYPIGLRVLSLLIVASFFDFDEEKVKEMGSDAPKVSLIIRLFMQHFLSVEKTVKESSRMWKEHYTVGRITPVETDEKEKRLIMRLEDINLHPLFCSYMAGYFLKIMEMVVKATVTCQETKCCFKGDQYHEYLFKW